MARAGSSFQEAVTGPAPDAALLVVTHDDAQRFAYELIESRAGEEVSRGAYDVSFSGSPSVSNVDGADLEITAARDAQGEVTLRAPRIGRTQAYIHVRRTGPDTAEIEDEVATDGAVMRLETISLVRLNGRQGQ